MYKENDIRKIDYYLLYVEIKLLLRGRDVEGIISLNYYKKILSSFFNSSLCKIP